MISKILGLIGISQKAGKLISGTDACIEGMKLGKIKLMLVSQEASEKTKKNLFYYCEKYHIPIHVIEESIEDLSKAIGKKNRAMIGIEDDNLSTEIKKVILGGDIIG